MLIKKSTGNNKKHIDIETLKKTLLKTSITYFWTDGSPVESTEKNSSDILSSLFIQENT